jgi:uncharacterized protein YciI
MWYAIEGFDGADVLAQRRAARPAHLARLSALRDAGRLLLSGPCPAIDAEDPYVGAGVYQRVEVRPFVRVLP